MRRARPTERTQRRTRTSWRNRRGLPRRGRRGVALALLVGIVLGAGSALAHGPTVEIRASGLSPVLLNLFEGTTVHFANTLDAPEGLVVLIDEKGDLRSPALRQPGDGWHYTFDRSGRFDVRIEGRPDWKMTIVVVAKRGG